MLFTTIMRPSAFLPWITIFVYLFVTSTHAQDVILMTQADVNAFDPATTYVNGKLQIGPSTTDPGSDITDLSNLSNITEVLYDVRITNNAELDNLDGLANLAKIGDALRIIYNPQLIHLDGLLKLKNIGGNLFINANHSLLHLDGLNNLDSIQYNLNILVHNSLQNLNGFSNLKYVGSSIYIHSNNLMTEINGFNKLESVGFSFLNITSDLYINSNSSLQTINGFGQLSSINGALHINENFILEEMTGFTNLKDITEFYIGRNSKLNNLDAFYNLTSVKGPLEVAFNNSLTNCCGIQDLLDTPGAIEGIIFIEYNPSECSSREEIINNNCDLDIIVNAYSPCIGDDNGSFLINVFQYDTIPFYYQWYRQEDGITGSGSSYDDFFQIEMLGAGTYDLMVTTAKPDTVIRTDIILTEVDGSVFEIIEIKSTNSSNGISNGSISLFTSGGAIPYSISWTGPNNGSLSGIMTDSINIPMLTYGEYHIIITDNDGKFSEVSVTLLDETIPTFPCLEPLDIVILNDVSGSVDSIEYPESKEFFVNFLQDVNIGPDPDASRAAIVEWSNADQQTIKIPMTGDINELNTYIDADKSFDDGTSIHEALIYGEQYLENVGRAGVEKVIILATDGQSGQVPLSLVALADQFKAKGYHILTIAFDDAYNNPFVRDVLFQMASIGSLAPGASAYSELDENLAENIVNAYLCPIDPGSTSNVYFNRDGSIDITNLNPLTSCLDPMFVEVEFTIEVLRQLSIPGGTFVTFYLNDPTQYGATKMLSWQIPCAIPAGSSESFIVTLPMNGPSHIYVVLNDDGSVQSPISLPITSLEEIAFSNNIDDEWICLNGEPTIQALKFSNTQIPTCDTIVSYTINVCNISEEDATGVIIDDQTPNEFLLIHETLNLNGCATENNGTYDLPAGCCLAIHVAYDAGAAPLDYYNDQDVLLSGPPNQVYLNYDGASSTAEDIILDGTIDCPSTEVEFLKEVNVMESCDDAFLTFTFTINNELNIPLHGLFFSDIVPLPSNWVFEPYNISGLSIGSKSINQNIAEFVIDEVQAQTIASFSFDISLNYWPNDGVLNNSATLANVLDLENGGIQILTSNTTTTQIITSPSIIVPDTIRISSSTDTIDLSAVIYGSGMISWTTGGDGSFVDSHSKNTSYITGPNDLLLKEVNLNINVENECYSVDENIIIIVEPCIIEIIKFEQSECNNNNTPNDNTDDYFTIVFELSASYPSLDSIFHLVIDNDTIGDFSYDSEHTISTAADGEVHVIKFIDSQIDDCFMVQAVEVESCSEQCELDLVQLLVTDCDDNDTPFDNSDDSYSINFIIDAFYPGMDSSYYVIIDNDTIQGFTYGDEQKITLNSNDNSGTIEFIDSQFESCFKAVNVGVENCIYPCEILIEQLIISECDDNGTIDNDLDDSFTVTFTISSSYSGLDSTYFAIVNSDTIGIFAYDSVQTISLKSDGTNQVLNFIDSYFSDCQLSDTINVQSCSNPCELDVIQLVVSDCSDNGTPGDASDDTYFINFNVFGIHTGSDSTYFVIIDNDTLGQFHYATEQIISLTADGIEDVIHFVDSQIETCFNTENILVESCSNFCDLIMDHFQLSECDDNGTPNNSLDDFYTLMFNISANNPGLDSTYLVISGSDTMGLFPYNLEHDINLPADGSSQYLSFMDSQFPICIITDTLNLENCSDPCELSFDYLNILACDDNGTIEDKMDDTYAITFSVSTSNPGIDSSYFVESAHVSYGPFPYNVEQSILLNADGIPDIINIIDTNFDYCFATKQTNLDHCSTPKIIDEDITIPNIFSPNDDGINDVWSIKINNGSNVISCNIYDRWGNLIYNSKRGDLPLWDGTFKGERLNSAVFVYKIVYQNINDETKMILGDVTLIK